MIVLPSLFALVYLEFGAATSVQRSSGFEKVIATQPGTGNQAGGTSKSVDAAYLNCIKQRMQTRLQQLNIQSSAYEHLPAANRYLCSTKSKRNKLTSSYEMDNTTPKVSPVTEITMSTTVEAFAVFKETHVTCQDASTLLSNTTNLRELQVGHQRIGCKSKRLGQLIQKLKEAFQSDLYRNSHRSKGYRQWRHLACKTYRQFNKCLRKKRQAFDPHESSTQPKPKDDIQHITIPLTTGSPTTTTTSNPMTTSTSKSTPETESLEAIHVSNPSKIDFMPFMIGDTNHWKDEYEMWFY